MTTEEIKKIVDDERAEQLTAQLCRHWEVAAQRLEGLVQELATGMDTCVEAELYAALMRMQSSVMVLMELNKMPCAFLFSEYLDRISQTLSDIPMRQAVMVLATQLPAEQSDKQQEPFFDMIIHSLTQHLAMSPEHRKAILEQASPEKYVISACAEYLNVEDLMMIVGAFQKPAGSDTNQEETTDDLKAMCQAMDDLAQKMDENMPLMLVWLMVVMLLPGILVNMMQQSRTDGKAMAQLFNKVLARVRDSTAWWNYWKDYRNTLHVVYDGQSKKEIMKAEQGKERAELGKVPGGLFAKWATDKEAFEADFLEAGLSDDDLRSFIFHLTALSEIARELNPTAKYGEEQLVRDETQKVGNAVLEAALRLQDLTDKAWFPHYNNMWQELIQNEEIFARLKVTHHSPHNKLFTARFFCHLVGEMKKRAVFCAHSDNDLAEKLTEKRSVGTFRKNIQEGMGEEAKSLQKNFDIIYQEYKTLAHPKK